MPVNNTHPDYDLMTAAWIRARDVLGGEDSVKVAGEKYLPKLEAQSDEEYQAYKARAVFFNAAARTLAGYVGMLFRKPPYIELPTTGNALGKAMAEFNNDADMLGTSLYGFSKQIVSEVVSVGRCGTLVDWEGSDLTGHGENRAYATLYRAEQILNWRVERVNGRSIPTLVVLKEATEVSGSDLFATGFAEQIRVLRLEETHGTDGTNGFRCVVDVWRPKTAGSNQSTSQGNEWELAETRVPLRLGKPLPLLPFVFHGPENSRPTVARVPLEDIIAMNLSHYRLDADFKHGLHYTALPTAWVSGFDKTATLKIGSNVAWVTENTGATAGFLEYMGQGLGSFERALDHAERLLAVLGSRLLEGQKKVAETAEAMQIRQSGEDCILSSIATSVSESITHVIRWAYWWNSTEENPEDITDQQALLDLNTDFRTTGMSAQEITALVSAWQAGAISQDTLFNLFRRSEIIPDGRGNAEEKGLIGKAKPSGKVTSDQLSVTGAATSDSLKSSSQPGWARYGAARL